MKPFLWDVALSVFLVVLGGPWWAGLLAFLGLRALGWLASISSAINVMAVAMAQAAVAAEEESARALTADEIRAHFETEETS